MANPVNYRPPNVSEKDEKHSDIGEINGRSVTLLTGMKIVGGLVAVIIACLAICGLLQLHHCIPNDATWLTNIGEPGLWSMLVGAIVLEAGIIASFRESSEDSGENLEIEDFLIVKDE